MLRKFVIAFSVLSFLVYGCATSKKKKMVRRRRPRYDYYMPSEAKSDISYYKERSPGAHRVQQAGALKRSLAGAAVDGKLLKDDDQRRDGGSLWTERSDYNNFFVKDIEKDIGDIVYINLKEDLRSMLRRSKKRYRSNAYRRALRARSVKRRGRKPAAKKNTQKASAAAVISGKKKKKSKKRLRKNTYIAARVIDRLSNGTLLLEGHKLVDVNKKLREILISGYVKDSDITPRGEVDSRKMADLFIDYIVVNKK